MDQDERALDQPEEEVDEHEPSGGLRALRERVGNVVVAVTEDGSEASTTSVSGTTSLSLLDLPYVLIEKRGAVVGLHGVPDDCNATSD